MSWNQVEVDMINVLPRDLSVVLQKIIIARCKRRTGNLFGRGNAFVQVVVGNLVQELAVNLGNDEHMATTQRKDVQKGDAARSFNDFVAWYGALNDFTKQARINE